MSTTVSVLNHARCNQCGTRTRVALLACSAVCALCAHAAIDALENDDDAVIIGEHVDEANACAHDCSCDCAECHIRGRRRVSAEDRRRIAR